MECGIKVYFPNSKIKVYHVIFWSGLKEIYLTEKKYIMYRHLRSSGKTIHAGVPQGSVLDSLLYLIYVNDASEKMLSKCRLFVDENFLYNIRQITLLKWNAV